MSVFVHACLHVCLALPLVNILLVVIPLGDFFLQPAASELEVGLLLLKSSCRLFRHGGGEFRHRLWGSGPEHLQEAEGIYREVQVFVSHFLCELMIELTPDEPLQHLHPLA